MSDPRILVCAPAMDADGSRASVELLRSIALPNASKFVITTGKFETDEAAKFNIESGYPAEPAQLQTFAAWAEMAAGSDCRQRDGYDLFCLRAVVRKHGAFSHAVLLRSDWAAEPVWDSLVERLGDRPYLVLPGPRQEEGGSAPPCNVLFDLQCDGWGAVLDLAWELYASGAAYALEDYCLEAALEAAEESLRIHRQLVG